MCTGLLETLPIGLREHVFVRDGRDRTGPVVTPDEFVCGGGLTGPVYAC